MSCIMFRRDLDPLSCDECQRPVFGGQLLDNHRFYCHNCAEGIEVGEVENDHVGREIPEVNFT